MTQLQILVFSNTFWYGITMQPFITNITQKSQVTIPREIRKILGLKPRDRVSLSIENGQLKIEKIPSILELAGFIKLPPSLKHGKAVESIEDGDLYERF